MLRHSLLLAALLGACAPAGSPPSAATPAATPAAAPAAAADPRSEIEAQFRRSAQAWNAGDLDGFMQDYARDGTTSYVAGGRLRRGWDRIRGGYAARFEPGAQRDSLRFEDFDVRALGTTHALVFARFILARGDSTTASGPFTLVMERRPEGWRIIHDHTSSD